MKGSRSVCLLCRHRIATAGKLRLPRWQQSRACPFSTTTLRSHDTAHDTTNAEKTSDQQDLSKVRKIVTDARQGDSSIKPSWNIPRPVVGTSGAWIDSLFQQIVQEQHASEDASKDPSSATHGVTLELFNAISELQDMIEADRPAADAYAYLKTEMYPIIRQPDVHAPQAFREVVSRLMEKVVAAKKADMYTDSLPTVADIFRIYADIAELKPLQWAALVGDLVRSILQIGPGNANSRSDANGQKQNASREAMLADLVESWKVLSLPQVAVNPVDAGDIKDGFWLPSLEKFHLGKFSKGGDFTVAFCSIFPQYPAKQLGSPVAVLAIATYTLLLDSQRTSANAKRSAISFITRIADLMTFVEIRDDTLRNEIASTFPDLDEYIMARWPLIRTHLKERVASALASGSPSQPATTPSPVHGSPRLFQGSLIAQSLTKVRVTSNSGEVDRLWQSFVGSGLTISETRAAELRKHPDIFNLFIHTRLALKQPDQAVKVWSTMVKVGLKPTLKTFNLMLDGCKKARNITGIRNVWTKLVASGMKLNASIWTTRVSGLIECGDIRAGIKVLEEMIQLWKVDPRSRSSAAIEPTVEPVNAAIIGLIRKNQAGAAEKLLNWAKQQGIKPDIFTFNAMLRLCIRDGTRDADVRKLFDSMQELGVMADEATFTIVLDSSFSKFDPGDPERQAQIVSEALSEMKAVGLETNMITYGKMVYLLLRSESTKAAKALLEHIWAGKNELSPQIYTQLVEYFFSRSPPDVKAVDRLLERLRPLGLEDMDNVFYDRLIKGYAIAGYADASLKMYYRVTDAGIPVILPTQVELLKELLRKGRVDDAKGVVNTTRKMSQEIENPRYWAHNFWHIATRYRLLDAKSPTPS
ncbi:hypothetical protein F5X99DRAFT_372670 [Biscogniauxia marginata]|nr:hypothetical protein F5X99DRAFT_372670 [Biscogniauxia marginata]